MFINGIKILKENLPDLLDQSAGAEVRAAIELFVDIAMGFDGRAPIAEVDRRIEAIKAAVRQELADAEISIQASPL